jgi:hypothetical protein
VFAIKRKRKKEITNERKGWEQGWQYVIMLILYITPILQ